MDRKVVLLDRLYSRSSKMRNSRKFILGKFPQIYDLQNLSPPNSVKNEFCSFLFPQIVLFLQNVTVYSRPSSNFGRFAIVNSENFAFFLLAKISVGRGGDPV